MRLITKQDRAEARKAVIGGRQTEIYKDLEILSYDQKSTSTDRIFYDLKIWRGTAGNPYINFWFSSAESRDEYIRKEKASADRREQYKAEQADNRGKVVSEAAKCSQLIKSILKKEYPSIKFSVRSSNGIPSKELDSFLRQFEYGSFDGMTDTYNYDNKREHPQAKYIMSHRSLSEEKRAIIQEQLANFYNELDSKEVIEQIQKLLMTGQEIFWISRWTWNELKGYQEQLKGTVNG